MSNLLLIVLDGCSLDYITKEATPNIFRIAKAGFYRCAKASVPSVSTVNHATILSGSFPSVHGISGNYFYDRKTGKQEYAGKQTIQSSTIFDLADETGMSSALLTTNGYLLDLIGRKLDFGISMDNPENILFRYLDMSDPPAPDSPEANCWILQACYRLIKKNNPGVVYCATNDSIFRNFEPGSKEAVSHMKNLDCWIGKIYDLDTTREIYITSDHGMSTKNQIINLQEILDDMNYQVVCHQPVKAEFNGIDDFRESGILYLYFKKERDDKKDELLNFLESTPYIDAIFSNKEAARKFNLREDQIGDYVIFAAEDCVFGEITGKEIVTEDFRTCGSLLEREIPLIAVNAREVPEKYRYSRDIVKILMGGK